MWDYFRTEAGIRLGCFVGVLVAMVAWELLAPKRRLQVRRPLRWSSNLGLVVLNTMLLRIAAPLGAVGVALFAESRGWGLFQNLAVPGWVAILVSVVLLDLAIYLQHVMFHAVPLFWRLHMVHHADLDIDVTTGLRFHTVEILLSFGIKAAMVLLLGAPAVAVLVFEVLLNATSMFNHSNIRMPAAVDRVLRWLVVTPDMHRVHHSVYVRETNSNFGFNLPWWDRLLGTYRDQPAKGHSGMTIGLSNLRDERIAERLHQMLLLPITGHSGDYPVNRRGPDPARLARNEQAQLDVPPDVDVEPEHGTVASEHAGRSPARGRAVRIVRWGSIFVVLVALFVIVRSLPVDQAMAAAKSWIADLGFWGPVALVLLYIVATILFVPGTILSLVAGAIFGVGLGTAVISVGSTIGASLAFLIARYVARDKVAEMAQGSRRFRAIDRAIAEGGWKIVALLRLSPAIPFNLQNYLYGLTAIRFWPYAVTSWIAMLPGTFLYVYIGHVTGAAVGADRERSAAEWSMLAIGLLATIVVTVYVTRLARRKLNDQLDETTEDAGKKASGAEKAV